MSNRAETTANLNLNLSSNLNKTTNTNSNSTSVVAQASDLKLQSTSSSSTTPSSSSTNDANVRLPTAAAPNYVNVNLNSTQPTNSSNTTSSSSNSSSSHDNSKSTNTAGKRLPIKPPLIKLTSSIDSTTSNDEFYESTTSTSNNNANNKNSKIEKDSINEFYYDDLDSYKDNLNSNKSPSVDKNTIGSASSSTLNSPTKFFSPPLNVNYYEQVQTQSSNEAAAAANNKPSLNHLSTSTSRLLNLKRHSIIGDSFLNRDRVLLKPNLIGRNEFQLPTKPPIKVTIEPTSSISSLCPDTLMSSAGVPPVTLIPTSAACKVCTQSGVPIIGGGVGCGVGSATNTYLHHPRSSVFYPDPIFKNTLTTQTSVPGGVAGKEGGPKPFGLLDTNLNPGVNLNHRASIHSIYHSHAHLFHPHFCNNNINECNCENCSLLKEYAAGIGLCGLPDQTGAEDSSEPKATYSYLKSYFVSMLQPSDNKLAMKLFGSKKGVLKEKLRQQEVGHWIIHPCSNFRYQL